LLLIKRVDLWLAGVFLLETGIELGGGRMKIAICQINPKIGDFAGNFQLLVRAAKGAQQMGCDLAVFPEMCTVGYPPRDLLEQASFVEANLSVLEQLAQEGLNIPMVCGYVDRNPSSVGKPLLNSVALIERGKVVSRGGKRLLPSYDVFDETRYFEPAQESLVFDLKGQKIGVTICEDIWNLEHLPGVPIYDLDPVGELVERHAITILINISASPFTINKGQLRLKILKAVAEKFSIPTIYCNQVGGNDELLFDGSSMVVDSRGRLIALGAQFEEEILIWDSEKPYGQLEDPWLEEEAAILKALVMGTRDYTRKCGFTKAIVGLSGGIDSSLVACIASNALGPENVMGVSMPSRYTSIMSKEDSKKLALNLGIRYEVVPIEEPFKAYKNTLAPLFHGLPEDETEENIQARIRGNILMALSNKFNYLVLATGNKSEIAMGYCTLYGDLTGGLAVISDVPKTMCYRLARFINRDVEIIPERVLTRPPSAELRANQTDQDSLPPYPVLDDILEAAVEERLDMKEIVSRGHDPKVVKDVLRRLALNEYKRRQAPPGLKVTSKAFGFGRRYPIACAIGPY